MSDKGQSTETYSLRLRPDQNERLHAAAARRSALRGEPFNKSRLVREAIDAWFEQHAEEES